MCMGAHIHVCMCILLHNVHVHGTIGHEHLHAHTFMHGHIVMLPGHMRARASISGERASTRGVSTYVSNKSYNMPTRKHVRTQLCQRRAFVVHTHTCVCVFCQTRRNLKDSLPLLHSSPSCTLRMLEIVCCRNSTESVTNGKLLHAMLLYSDRRGGFAVTTGLASPHVAVQTNTTLPS